MRNFRSTALLFIFSLLFKKYYIAFYIFVQFIVLFFILQVYNMWKIYLFAFKICYTGYFFFL